MSTSRRNLPEDVMPRGVDVDNDVGSDSTLDTDGKTRDARLQGAAADPGALSGRERLSDHEVISNATLENAVLTPPSGLAGFDSRPHGAQPDVQADEGSQVVDIGFVEQPGLYESAGDDADADPVEGTEKRRQHVPANNTRVGHHIQFAAREPAPPGAKR